MKNLTIRIGSGFLALSLAVSVLFSGPVSALATDTGFQVPTSTHTPNDWDTNTVTNIQTSDNVDASDNDDQFQGYSSFALGVPAGSVIQGIEVQVEAASTDNTSCQVGVNLSWNNGTSFATGKTQSLNNTDTLYTLGSSSDTWGHAWLASELSDANFVVRLQDIDTGGGCDGSATTSVDLLQVRVTYISPSTITFYDGFGTGSTDSTFNESPEWLEGGAGAEKRASGSGDDSASPDAGRLAVMFGDDFGTDGYICAPFDTTGSTGVNLSYFWRGDSDANNSSDTGVVQVKPSASGNCNDSSGWTTLKTHSLQTTSWTEQAAFTNAGLDNTTFLLRFAVSGAEDNENFRVDGVTLYVPGTIVVDKVTVPGADPQSFDFDAVGGSYADFALTDAATPNNQSLAPGNYTVTELGEAGWTLTNLVCVDPTSNTTYSVASGQAQIDLASGETVTCTYTNEHETDLYASKSNNVGGFGLVGVPFDWTITVFNLDDAVDGAATFYDGEKILTDDLPSSGATYGAPSVVLSGGVTGTVDCSITANTLTCTADGTVVFPDGGSMAVTFSATPTGGSLVNPRGGGICRADPDNVVVEQYASNNECGDTVFVETPATLIVIKDTVPNAAQDFHFDATGTGLSDFDLDDDADGTLSNTKTFTNLYSSINVGTYSVVEDVVSGYTTTVSCSDQSPASAIDLSAGETVTCTFTNTQKGHIIIVKDSLPNDAQDFTFSTDFAGIFSLDDDADGTLANTKDTEVVPGSYAILEQPTPGWDTTSAVCDSGETVVDIDVEPGETVTCTFTNTKHGSISGTKLIDTDGDGVLEAGETTGVEGVTITLNPGAVATTTGPGGAYSFTDLLPGTYTITESAPAGTVQTTPNPSPIVLGAGQDVTGIDFGNFELVTITGIKYDDTNGNGQQDPTEPGIGDWHISLGRVLPPQGPQIPIEIVQLQLTSINPISLGEYQFSGVGPGHYIVLEEQRGGWVPMAPQVDSFFDITYQIQNPPPFPTADSFFDIFIDVSGAQVASGRPSINQPGFGFDPTPVPLHFGNFELITVTIEKNVVKPDGVTEVSDTYPFDITFDGNLDTIFEGSSVSFSNIGPGVHTLVEMDDVNYDFVSIKHGDDVLVDGEFTPVSGEDMTIVVTNKQKTGTITVTKNTVGGDGTFTLTGPNGDFSVTTVGGIDTEVITVAPGTGYSVSEVAPAGWDVTYNDCSGITVGSNGGVGCTVTNTKRGHIIVDKVTNPALASTTFSFDADGGTYADFALSDTDAPNDQELIPGAYSVSETEPAGWDLTLATCTSTEIGDLSTPAAIDLDAGETVTCTFNNKDIQAPVITVTGNEVVNVEYGTGYTGEGATAVDNVDPSVTVVVTGTENISTSDPVNTYTTFYNATDAAGNVAVQKTRTINVTAKAASVTPDASGKTYGDLDPVLTGSLSGFIPADGVTATYARTAGENVGPYVISATLSPVPVLSNYSITYNTANFEITAADALCTISGYSGVYDALAHGATGECTGVGGPLDVLSGLSLGASFTDVPGGTANWTFSNPNYLPEAGSVPIELVALSLTGSFTADNKTYDGNNSATVLTRSLATVIAPDVVTLDGGTATFDNENIGVGKTVALAGATLGGLDAGNYSLGSVNTTTANITSVAVTVVATASDKVYDSTTDASVTLDVTGEVGGDILGATFTDADFDNKNVGIGKTVTVSGIALTGTNSGNYTFNDPAIDTANITPYTGLIATATAADKVYDGNDSATALLSFGNIFPGDDVTPSGYASATFDNANVGVGKLVTVTGITGTGADVGNYTWNTSDTDLADITKKTASVTPDASGKVFGDVDPAFTGALSGFLLADGITATYSRTAGETVVGSPYTISADLDPDLALDNYDITYNTAAFNITIATSETTITCPASVVYNGAAQEPCSTSVTGPGGLNLSPVPVYTDNTNVGTAGASYTYAGDENHTGSSDSETFAITKTTSTIEITNDLDLALTDSVVGQPVVVNWAVDAIAEGTPTGTVTVKNGGTPVCSGPVGDNTCTIPAFTSPQGTSLIAVYSGDANITGAISTPVVPHTIVKANTTTTITNGTELATNTTVGDTYTVEWDVTVVAPGVSPITGTVTVTGGSGCSAPVADGQCDVTSVEAGEKTLVATYGGDSNLNGSASLGTPHTVDKAVLTITADDKGKVYGEADPPFTFTPTGFVGGVDGTIDTPPVCGTVLDHEDVGTYPISCAAGSDANYTFDYEPGTFTVSTKALTITADNQGKEWGATFSFLGTEFTTSALEAGDSVTSVTLTSLGAPAGAAVGPYDITPSAALGTGLGNYAITYENGTMTVADSVIPDTIIDTTPTNPTSDNTPSFTFSATEDATFTCSVDAGPGVPCVSPFTSAPLADGPHTFSVFATDTNGNPDPSPAEYAWTIDTAGPETTITDGPADASTVATDSGAFTFTSEVGATFTCTLDIGLPVACNSGTFPFGPLADGVHTFSVFATDTLGNPDPTPATRTWTVDAVGPEITGEDASAPTDTTILVTWTTDELSTSRVVYQPTVGVSDVDAEAAGNPNYGYAFSTVEDPTLTTAHSVLVTGLTPSTTYYFRGVSHGSPETISDEVTESTTETPATTATVVMTKIVCKYEADLPNWGNSGAEATIDENTATDFLETHPTCHLEPDWTFQYAPNGTGNPGDEAGEQDSPWVSVAPTDENGVTTFEIPATPANEKTWFREVLKAGYIAFSGWLKSGNDVPTEEEEYSAEIYCNSDVLNYDNYDWIKGATAGETYDCVAFNAKTAIANSCPVPDELGDTAFDTIGTSPEGEDTLQEILDGESYGLSAQFDQWGYQSWTVTPGATVTINPVRFVDKFAGHNQVFGYYVDGDISSFTAVFKTGSVTGYEATLLMSAGPFSVTVPDGATSIGFAIRSFSGNTLTGTFATENSLNDVSEDHVLVYNPAAGTYALAFEDLKASQSSDWDHNDLVVEVTLACEIPETPDTGSITVCKLAVDADGNLVTETTTEFTIPGITPDPVTSAGAPVGEIDDSVFESPLTPNMDVVPSIEGNDAECVTYSGLTLGIYYYGEESMSDESGWQTPKYNDQFETDIESLSDFFSYEGTLFDGNAGDDMPRNENADGSITLTEDRPDRTLVVLNRLEGEDGEETPECDEGEVLEGDQCVPEEDDDEPEIETSSVPECRDGIDNDGDGLVDRTFDPGCTSTEDDSEENTTSSGGGGGGGGGNPNFASVGNGGGGPSTGSGQAVQGQVLGASCGLYMDKYLRRGSARNNSEQTGKLQAFLIKHGYLKIAAPTNFFGPMTEEAVHQFQTQYSNEILSPWNLSASTGIAYLATLRQINLIECPELLLQLPALIPWSLNPNVQ